MQPAERLAAYVRPDEMHQAFNFEYLDASWTAADQRAVIARSLAATAAVGAPTTWVLSNHDVVRHATRLGLPVGTPRPHGIGIGDPQPDAALGLRRARAATLLMLALPGSAYLYQGEELGLPEHTTLPDDVRQDPTWFRSGGTRAGPRRLPGADPVGGGRAVVRLRPDRPQLAAAAGGVGGVRRRPAGGVAGSTFEMYAAGAAPAPASCCSAGAHCPGWTVTPTRWSSATRACSWSPTSAPSRWRCRRARPCCCPAAPLDDDGRVPTDVTVWARVP